TGDDVQDAGWDPGLERELTEPDRGQRGVRGGLEDGGVAGSQRRRDLPRGHEDREVPRHDQPDDTDWLAQREVETRLGHRDRLAVDLVRGTRVVVEDEARTHDLAAGAADRLADVAALEPGQLFAVLLDQIGELGERPATLAGGPVRPAGSVVERRARRGHGAVHVLAATQRRRGDHPASGRVDHLECLPVRGVHRFAADHHPGGRRSVGCGGVGRALIDGHWWWILVIWLGTADGKRFVSRWYAAPGRRSRTGR